MPKYYCDYCDTYLTHDSPSVRKTHCQGRKHKDNVRYYYQKWMEDKAQQLIDETTAAYKAGKIATNPYAPGKGVAIPPPMVMPPGAIPGPPMPLPPGMPPQPMMAPPVIPPPNVNSMMVPPPMMRPAGAPVPPMMGAVMQVPPMAPVRPPLLSAPLPQVAK